MKEMKKQDKRIMTIKEVSDYLNIPTSTIYELVRKGKIRGVKFGKHWRVLEQDIQCYLHGSWQRLGQKAHAFERRQYSRINSEIPAKLMICLNEKSRLDRNGFIRNLSEGGALFLYSSLPGSQSKNPEVGDPITLLFKVPDADASEIKINGRIVHLMVNSKIGTGIKFKDLSDKDREVIRNHVG